MHTVYMFTSSIFVRTVHRIMVYIWSHVEDRNLSKGRGFGTKLLRTAPDNTSSSGLLQQNRKITHGRSLSPLNISKRYRSLSPTSVQLKYVEQCT
ncbi:hypothetical protein L218DRAFT_272751 [Marasmius fiardii PR-910]|nr:hypothetical protein L218DRAFT_272751 [Marasmius fiardii PR-910]